MTLTRQFTSPASAKRLGVLQSSGAFPLSYGFAPIAPVLQLSVQAIFILQADDF
jgi:hypothetical protein